MNRISPNIQLHHEIWENTDDQNIVIPKILKKPTNNVLNSNKFWRRQDLLVPNTTINVKKKIETVHLLENDDDYCPKDEDDEEEENPETEPLLNDDRCIYLSSILDEDECENLISVTEKLGYNSIESEYVKEYRNSERVVVTSKKLTGIVWERIVPYLNKSDFKGVKPYGFDNKGKWIPIGLNPALRFNKYSENTFFKPHMDAQHCNNDNERSIFTVLIYLDYCRYGTRLLKKVPNVVVDNNTSGDDETSCAVMSFKELTTVRPSSGGVLIFNHDLYHAGDRVRYGNKYIIRTEMMFKRVDSESIHRMDYTTSEEYLKVRQLVEESTVLEKQGKVRESTLKYLKAHQLQVDLSHSLKSDHERDSCSFIEEILPEEIFVNIFSYLPLIDLAQNILYLNRTINEYARNSSMWKVKYLEKWPIHMTINNELVYNYTYYSAKSKTTKRNDINIESVENDNIAKIESERTSIFGDSLKDWYQTFVCRANMERYFCPVLLDVGSRDYHFGLTRDSTFLTSPTLAGQPDHPHFHLPNFGMEDIVIGDRYIVTKYHCNSIPLLSDKGKIEDFNHFKILLCQLYSDDLKVQLKEHPLLLSVSPLWSESDLKQIKSLVFELEIPALCMVDSRELLSYYYQKPNCLLVHVGASGNMCTAIFKHKPLKSTCHSENLFLKTILVNEDSHAYGYNTEWSDHLLQMAIVPPVFEQDGYSEYKKFVSGIKSKDVSKHSYTRYIVSGEKRVEVGQTIALSVLSQISLSIQSLMNTQELTQEEKEQVLENVVIVGGFSHIENLTTRLTELIPSLYPPPTTTPAKISPTFTLQSYQPVPEVERRGLKYSFSGGSLDVVGGAKIYASLNSFIDQCTFIDEQQQ